MLYDPSRTTGCSLCELPAATTAACWRCADLPGSSSGGDGRAFAPELVPETPKPGLGDRVTTRTSWLSKAEGGFEPPVRQRRTTVFEGARVVPVTGACCVWIPFCAAGIPLWWCPVR